MGSEVYCAILDASQAFDKVLHNSRFLKLIKRCSHCFRQAALGIGIVG